LSNEDLLNKVKQKDRAAFNELFTLYKSKVFKTAYFILQDKVLTEDVVQEVFLQIYFKIDSLRQVETFDIWIYKITVNFCRRLLNKRSKLSIVPLEEYEDNLEANGQEDLSLPEDILLNKELCSDIMNEIYKLPEYQRIPIILYYYNNLSIKDISEVMNCSEGTVKSRLFHGKKLLKHKLEESAGCEKESSFILNKGVNIYDNR